MDYFSDRSETIKSMACGCGFTLFAIEGRKKQNLLYGCGINTDSQIGYHFKKKIFYNYLLEPSQIHVPLLSPMSTKYKHLACGRAHSIVVTDREGIFSFGNNAHGQCARPIIEDEVFNGSQLIHRVAFDKEVKQVVCGLDHTLILTTDGDVYSCGLGADGQTGLGHYDAVGELTKVRGDIEGVRIAQLSCRGDCVLAVSEEGDVFGWGNSEYGQFECVAPGSTQVATPLHLPVGPIVGKVTQVAASGSSCALLNDEGNVFVWGYGILGKGPKVDILPMPSQIPSTLFGRNELNSSVKIKEIYCGMNNYFAKTIYGELYSWGRNSKAVCGLGHVNDQFFPIQVHLAPNVRTVVCGADHAIALCKND